jgi:hypothetical protein
VSDTKLADKILPPRLVRELDWVENFWPGTRKGKGHVYPKVQLYCLMGVATAWTVSDSCSQHSAHLSLTMFRIGILILRVHLSIITFYMVRK